MRPNSAHLGRLFCPSGIGSNHRFPPYLQQAAYLLPVVAGSSCRVEDARRLFVRCSSCDQQRLDGMGKRHGDASTDAGTVFDESVVSLQRLGLVSLTHDEPSAGGDAKLRRLRRDPVINVMLQSINVTSSQSSDKEKDTLFQLLHGVIVPLIISGLAASSAPSPSRRGPRLVEEVSVESCFSLLQQPRGKFTSINDTTCRFMTDLVGEALLFGVCEQVLFPCGGGLFRLHRERMQQLSPCLLTLQWWWWQRVDASLRHALKPRAAGENVPLEAHIDAAQERVQYWIKKRDAFLPQFLLRVPMDDTMALVADAVRCWLPYSSLQGQQALSLPMWRLHLSDEAKTRMALETLQSIQSLLVRRPAGISLSELSELISWSTVSSLLQKKSLLKMLMSFPSHFVVHSVHGTAMVQLQLRSSAKSAINAADVTVWVLGSRNDSVTTTATFLQEVDLVIRAVEFLRKRYLLARRVTYEDLREVLVPAKDSDDGEAFLDVLRRYDVVADFDAAEVVSWTSVHQRSVCLSPRESAALKAIETARKAKGKHCQLCAEAIKLFLFRCNEEVTAAEIPDAFMPIAYLQRWLQSERLPLTQADLFKVLRECALPFAVDERAQCIRFRGGEMTGLTPADVPLPPEAPKAPTLSLPPPPLSPSMASVQKLTFDSQLARVLKGQQPDALLRFAEATIHAVFVVLLPLVSVPSGMRLQTLLRRVRWGSVAATLGVLPSFLEAFEGLFFDVLVDRSAHVEDTVVAAFRGHVGPWLLYARLISRLFPSDVDIPLQIVAEGLSWGVWFAPRFGDLPTLLRRVGRSCRDGYLFAKKQIVTGPLVKDDAVLWELLVSVRKQEDDQQQQQQHDGNGIPEAQQYVFLNPTDFCRYMRGTNETDNNSCGSWMQLAEAAVRRFPLFFQWYSASIDSTPLLRIALKCAFAPTGLVALVEEYVCPLLRQRPDRGISIAELDDRLGWSRGNFDTHPTGVSALGVAVSSASLYGVLQRYVEVEHSPRLLLLRDATKMTAHDAVMVRPDTAIYRSPEDMLLEINGLEYMASGSGTLRPSNRPISLFELLAEEQELQGGEIPSTPSRPEEWCVSLLCDGNTATEWERELANGSGDVLVWCDR
ncbi:hypothetical protein TraAM80_04802 [Trypanosoma rangeli]|uniref:Uncharacterized protein n=1 Tax=Trypanosoma rangeli TaxID=5698 RepID=A0A3R7LWY0_TRYRA|nr:uncharacterized protein TraAM80_04802 [Trypanosoma rangeli]RNF04949.1 hypothetical protein TraAM80_04802 [Trypanosoma rangeli]|eukprot:RNF04949.1 hypothetical protein TraAM80_04802 [Trypanosoma rangeli]